MKKAKSRRQFLKSSVKISAGAFLLPRAPMIVPASFFTKEAPSNKINIGQIGCGRIAMTHDLVETFKHDAARIIAMADVDRYRLEAGKSDRRLVPEENREDRLYRCKDV